MQRVIRYHGVRFTSTILINNNVLAWLQIDSEAMWVNDGEQSLQGIVLVTLVPDGESYEESVSWYAIILNQLSNILHWLSSEDIVNIVTDITLFANEYRSVERMLWHTI